MSDYPMLISNKLHSFRNFYIQIYGFAYIFGRDAHFLGLLFVSFINFQEFYGRNIQAFD